MSYSKDPAQIEEVMLGFLRKPRSRAALEALASDRKFVKKYVIAWLNKEIRTGRVVKHKSGNAVLYSLDLGYVHEEATPSEYPSWLDPRTLPVSRNRTLIVDGVATSQVK